MRSRVRLCVLILLCSGCGHGPAAVPIRSPDANAYPLRPVHFVERGVRGRGVFVEATPGYSRPLSPNWGTVLVPLAPSGLAGPAWTGRSVRGDRARAIAALPRYRHGKVLSRYGDAARRRFRQHFVWVLGTDPLILGLPSARPVSNWTFILTPRNPWPTHFVLDQDLDQPVGGLVVYPPGFWAGAEAGLDLAMEVSLVSLAGRPRVGEVLDAIAAGDTSRLGEGRNVPLDDVDAPGVDEPREPRENRDRPSSR